MVSMDGRWGRSVRSRVLRVVCVLPVLALVAGGCATSDAPTPADLAPAERASARRNLGIDHYLNGRVALAIRELKHSLTLEPDDAKAHMWLGEAYRRRGHLDLAEQEMRRSLELAPDDHEANLRFSVLLIQLERYAESIEFTNKLIEDPTFESPWRPLTNRGWAYLKLGRYEVARESFEEALDYQVAYWPAKLNLGILANLQGEYAEALEFLDAVVQADPGASPTAEANYRMAEVFVSLGLRERAIDCLERAIASSPNGRWGKQSREYLRRLGARASGV